MDNFKITNFNEFCDELLKVGFSMGGGNSDGIYAVVPFTWKEEPENTNIKWHTENPETDPWEWRIRVLDERADIAYSKLFFKKSGFITKEWYPYFLAVRRPDGLTLKEAYKDGTISHYAKRIYSQIEEYAVLPSHAIKELGGFSKEEKSKFDSAINELQMKMFITICGRRQKVNIEGVEYGWSSTMFCTTEQFFHEEVFDVARKISPEIAREKITEQIYKLNPNADAKKIKKFIDG